MIISHDFLTSLDLVTSDVRASAKCGLVLLVMMGLVGRRDVEQARYYEALGHRPRSVRPG